MHYAGMGASEVTSIRTGLGLSYEQLGAVLGVHRTTVWRWEQATTPVPKATAMAMRALTKKSVAKALAEQVAA